MISKVAHWCIYTLLLGQFLQCHSPKQTSGIPEDVDRILSELGEAKTGFTQVIEHYSKPEDSLKREAAYFLIRNMEGHYYLEPPYLQHYNEVLQTYKQNGRKDDYLNKSFDSLNQLFLTAAPSPIPDYKALTPELLIENIDYAFKAWQYPWAKSLSFTEFCEYLLPYKVQTEKPVPWRKDLYNRLQHVLDSLPPTTDRRTVCTVVNDQLRWFKFKWPFMYPVSLDYYSMLSAGIGKCLDATTLTVYAMRVAGIPAAVDFTTQWGNRNFGHSWNSVMYEDGHFVSFQGTESNPGEAKIEYDPKEDWTFKRAKIFRKTFMNSGHNELLRSESKYPVPAMFSDDFYRDVTAAFVPVADIDLPVNKASRGSQEKFMYLCAFNNENWIPIDWGTADDNSVSFKNVGRSILYIAADYVASNLLFATPPFSVSANGEVKTYIADTTVRTSVRLTCKYPYNLSNLVKINDQYELSYWDNGWQSLGTKQATEKYLVFDNVPDNALLKLHDVSRGKQERPFIVVDNQQVFW
jgi:hypothetical protein